MTTTTRGVFMSVVVALVVGGYCFAASAESPGPSYAQFMKARNERLGAWLPKGESLFEPWRRHLTVPSSALGDSDRLPAPARATYFWYGNAGPPRVQVVYDRARRVALYYHGCCAWYETVLIAAPKEPPSHVAGANLAALKTRHGIGLGASPEAVMRAYGSARLHAATTSPELQVLSYYRDQHTQGSACGWFTNFVFRQRHAVEIQTGHGC